MDSTLRKDYLVAGLLMFLSWLAVWSLNWILALIEALPHGFSDILFASVMLLVSVVCLALGALLKEPKLS